MTRQFEYVFTPDRSGDTMETAVKIYAYNMISGDRAAEHLVKSRFPRSTGPHDYDEKFVGQRWYHVYRITDSDGHSRQFWINATDYHGFF